MARAPDWVGRGSGLADLVRHASCSRATWPEPWRATKWAWTWLTPRVGVVRSAASASSSSAARSGCGARRTSAGRLTGGWAFLIAVVFLGGSSSGT